jgi:hypothetical protein
LEFKEQAAVPTSKNSRSNTKATTSGDSGLLIELLALKIALIV